MERRINQKALKEIIESIPQMIIEIKQIFPKSYPNKSYVQDWKEFPQDFILSLPEYNEKCYNLCKQFYIKAVEKGWACIAHHYVSTGGGEEREEYYVLSTEIMDTIANMIPKKIPRELEQKIHEIRDKLYALKFLFHYNPLAYNGLEEYSSVKENIISYLKELTDFIDTSKDLFVSGFSSKMPFLVRNNDAYESKIIEFERELDKQLTDLISKPGTLLSTEPPKPPVQPPRIIPPVSPPQPISPTYIDEISVGFECGTGEEIKIKPAHLFISGLTQKSGKTTTLEALLSRCNFPAITFITKPGEKSFETENKIEPYFKDEAKWDYLVGIFESMLNKKISDNITTILMELCEDTKSISDLKTKVEELVVSGKPKQGHKLLKGYLEKLFEVMGEIKFSDKLNLANGINIMDISNLDEIPQSLVINAVLDEIMKKCEHTIVLLPEAWKFIPQKGNRPCNRPCKYAIMRLARQGAAKNNFVWFDSQDIAGVDKAILKQVSIWLLGYQSEINEVRHTINQIPLSKTQKPTEDQIMKLKLGEFFICTSEFVKKIYVWPKWMEKEEAIKIAQSKVQFKER